MLRLGYMNNCTGTLLVRDGRVLVRQRSKNRSSYPGVWDVIGGHANSTESPSETLVRKLAEEIDVIPADFLEVAMLSEIAPKTNFVAEFGDGFPNSVSA